MELMPAHVTRGYTLLVFGTATVVGVPLLVWRSQADESVSEAAQIFALTAVMALLVVGIWSVWRTRRELRRAQAMPDDATVHGGGVWWRVLFVGLGICGGVAPFGRDGFNEGDSTFAAFGYGLIAGVLMGQAIGFWYLRRREADAGELLVFGGAKGVRKQIFVR
jgi:hypothetical protein